MVTLDGACCDLVGFKILWNQFKGEVVFQEINIAVKKLSVRDDSSRLRKYESSDRIEGSARGEAYLDRNEAMTSIQMMVKLHKYQVLPYP